MTCSPKLNVVAAAGGIVRLSEEAVMVSEPPPTQAPALAERALARLLSRNAANRKKREGVMMIPQLFELLSGFMPAPITTLRSTDRDQSAVKLAVREAACSDNDFNLPVASRQKTLDEERIGLSTVNVEETL